MPYIDALQNLGRIEKFDPRVFASNEEWPAAVCNFIVSLAVASNDLHDIIMAKVLLKEERDKHEQESDTRYRALSGGVTITLLRVQVGVIHELLNLVAANSSVLRSGPFKRVYRKLSSDSRESWDRICEAALTKSQPGSVSQALLLCRNKVGFHYDSKQIGRGYRRRFLSDSSGSDPLLSRGGYMAARRFYFADAAVEQYISDLADNSNIEDAFLGRGQLIEDINRALYELVTCFVTARGFAWRVFRE